MMKEVKFKEKKLTKLITRNWDYLSFLLLLFGFILSVVGFWETETVLWNRIKYTTGAGSQWSSANPIYLNTPLSQLTLLLIRNIIYYIIGNFLIIIVTAMALYKYVLKKSWFKTSKIFIGVLGVFSILAVIIGFWLRYSIIVLEALPSRGGSISGYEWIRVDIGTQSAIIESFSLTFMISSLTTLFITLFVIFKKLYQKRRKSRELSVIIEGVEHLPLLSAEGSKKKSFNSSYKSSLKNVAKNIPLYFILLLYLIFTLFPVYLAVMASFSTPYEINTGNLPSDPIRSMIMNYSSVMFTVGVDEPAFRNALFNSLFIGFGTSFFGLVLSVASAYALARFKFRGKKLMTFIILSTQMFPAIILLIPQYLIMSNLGLLERNVVLLGLLIVMATGSTAYVTWMMKGYFETIPVDIEEAAYIDGYGKLRTFIKIVIPLAKSGMVAVMVFTFLSAWQEFVLARTFIGETDPRATLPLLFFNYQNLNAPDNPTFYELLSPYAILVAMPVVIFYLVMQRQLVSGVVAGGVK